MKVRGAPTVMVSCLTGEQHELFSALGWAVSGDRQLPPTLNISLRTFLTHPGSVAHRGGEEVGRAQAGQDSRCCLLPRWAWRNHPPRGNNAQEPWGHQRKGLCCPQGSSAGSQLVLRGISFWYFQISPEFFPATEKGTEEPPGESLASLYQFTHPGPAIQTPGQRWGVGKGREGKVGWEKGRWGHPGVGFSYLGQEFFCPCQGHQVWHLGPIQELSYKVSFYE